MELIELSTLLEGRIDGLLSPDRARHSRGVAGFAAELCLRNGLDPERGRAAGLAHDLCKELPLGEQLELAAIYAAGEGGFEPSSSLLGEKIVHGPAAAGLLMRDYGIRDGDFLEALARHTIGKPGMGKLAILLYAADKIEPGRAHVDEAFRKACLGLAPEALLLAVLENLLSWLKAKGYAIAPETILLYNSLRPGADKR